MRALIIAAMAALAACSSNGGKPRPAPAPSPPADKSGWQIGPIIDGRNYSLNPPPLQAASGAIWAIAFPQAGSVHYVTFQHGSLRGKSRISMRYRIDPAPGAIIAQRNSSPPAPSSIRLYIQRRGDDWGSSKEAWRWWCRARDGNLGPGEHQLECSLQEQWTSALSSRSQPEESWGKPNYAPEAFAAALADAGRIGFTFSGRSADGQLGAGHGAFATGPLRFTLLDFRVE